MKRNTGFFSDELSFWHTQSAHVLCVPTGGWVQPSSSTGHAESPETKRRLKSLLEVSGLSRHLLQYSATPASQEDLLRVHTAEYLQRFKAMSDAGGGYLGPEAPIGPGSYEIACLSAGLAMAAVDAVLSGETDNAYALSRPPGHHSLADGAMGVCFLANIAIAIEAAKVRHGLGKVAVVDWDVHHGNGTQSIFESRGDVLTISVHQDGCFPHGYSGEEDRGYGEGLGANINIPLPPGSGHEAYLHAMERIVLPALERFEPDLIIVACGYDASAVDPMARMLLHSESFRLMTRALRQAAERLCQGRLVLVHEGGYSEVYVPFCGLATIEELVGVRTEVDDPMLEAIQLQQPKEAFLGFQRQLIERMAQDYLA
ncbi:class II histone deacetylase [Pseudomonas sp.]|uniref:class II histone deacetylase n=1 Tax=Pseudomonas sp. TaxID=306 RepID=UPI00261F7D21|nr:class II histone deacetylase [Pseudomonas sp.]